MSESTADPPATSYDAASMPSNAFDLEAFKSLFGKEKTEREDIVYMARTAESAERYEDMCKFMRYLVQQCSDQNAHLTVEERNLLSVAYKNVIGARRASWRTLNAEEHKEDVLNKEYKRQVELELRNICEEVVHLLEEKLLFSTDMTEEAQKVLEAVDKEKEAQVFYLKMTGDYNRYLAESVTDDKHDFHNNAKKYYKEAYAIAEKELNATHPIRLGLALNFSVCYYEILNDKNAACTLAKKAFDDAISKLDKLDEADYKDSTLIMQLLRDNLTLWTSSEDQDADIVVEDVED